MNRRYSEHDPEHYDRPNRRGSRPRTKERPTYDDAVDGVIVTVDRGRFTLVVEGRQIWAVKARPLGRKGVVVGDRVRVSSEKLGVLENIVATCDQAPPWKLGVLELMRNLAGRGLLGVSA